MTRRGKESAARKRRQVRLNDNVMAALAALPSMEGVSLSARANALLTVHMRQMAADLDELGRDADAGKVRDALAGGKS